MPLKKLGVLALQGSYREHIASLKRLDNVEAVEVKTLDELNSIHGLIIPGGESTTMLKLLYDFGLLEPLRNRIKAGMAVWGTCAGLILLAEKVSGEELSNLAVLSVTVRRNAYGSQLDSFIARKVISEVSSEQLELVFIRAPWVEDVYGDAKVLAEHEGKIIAVKQDKIVGTSFHPELTQDLAFHRYFAGLCDEKILKE